MRLSHLVGHVRIKTAITIKCQLTHLLYIPNITFFIYLIFLWYHIVSNENDVFVATLLESNYIWHLLYACSLLLLPLFRPAPKNTETEAPCSLYMRELQSFISRCQADYLSQFKCRDFIMDRYVSFYIFNVDPSFMSLIMCDFLINVAVLEFESAEMSPFCFQHLANSMPVCGIICPTRFTDKTTGWGGQTKACFGLCPDGSCHFTFMSARCWPRENLQTPPGFQVVMHEF